MATSTTTHFGTPSRFARAACALLAVLFLAATAAVAAPPPGKGKNKDGGGGGGDTGSGYQANLQFKWRIPLGGMYSNVRPSVAADGTIYVVDVADNLFAITPEGEVAWTVPDAGSKGLDIGPDGTIYTGNENWIKAFRHDGSLKWTFVQNPRAFVLIDVAVGPDGNVYAVASSGMGIFALDPNGNELWRAAEPYGRTFVGYTEIAFGPAYDGVGHQLGFAANGHVRVVRTINGETVFTTGGGLKPPRTSPLDGSWHLSATAYEPNGQQKWAFGLGEYGAFSTAAIGGDGTHYTLSPQYPASAHALNPDGSERWQVAMDEPSSQVDVDPSQRLLLVAIGGSSNQPAALRAMSAANGQSHWRMEFPPDLLDRNQYVDTNAAFDAGGETAYIVTAVASSNTALPRAYLNAIATDPSLPDASTTLRSSSVTIDSRSRRRQVNFTGEVVVVDENRAPVSGATVAATWTRPDGTTETHSAETAGGGRATFKISGDGGLYWLTVTDIAKPEYAFDPLHGVLEGAAVGY